MPRLSPVACVQQAADWVAALTGAKRAMLAVGAGAISVLAFAPIHAWPVLFLSFGLMVWLLDGCAAREAIFAERVKCAALTGFWFGFGYFLTGLYWIAEAFLVEPWRHGWLIPFAMTGLAGGMALFYAAAAALAVALWRPGAARVFALAIAFGLAEFARGHVLTGLPWNLIGYGLAANAADDAALGAVRRLRPFPPRRAPVRRSLRHLGAAGLGARATPRAPPHLALALLVALGAGALWGERRLATAEVATTSLRLRIVQANVDQANKWRPENSVEIFDEYLALTKSGGGARGFEGIGARGLAGDRGSLLSRRRAGGARRHRRCAAGGDVACRLARVGSRKIATIAGG